MAIHTRYAGDPLLTTMKPASQRTAARVLCLCCMAGLVSPACFGTFGVPGTLNEEGGYFVDVDGECERLHHPRVISRSTLVQFPGGVCECIQAPDRPAYPPLALARVGRMKVGCAWVKRENEPGFP